MEEVRLESLITIPLMIFAIHAIARKVIVLNESDAVSFSKVAALWFVAMALFVLLVLY